MLKLALISLSLLIMSETHTPFFYMHIICEMISLASQDKSGKNPQAVF